MCLENEGMSFLPTKPIKGYKVFRVMNKSLKPEPVFSDGLRAVTAQTTNTYGGRKLFTSMFYRYNKRRWLEASYAVDSNAKDVTGFHAFTNREDARTWKRRMRCHTSSCWDLEIRKVLLSGRCIRGNQINTYLKAIRAEKMFVMDKVR